MAGRATFFDFHESSIPLFSPTQVPEKETILHSIFSPHHDSNVFRGEEKKEEPRAAAIRRTTTSTSSSNRVVTSQFYTKSKASVRLRPKPPPPPTNNQPPLRPPTAATNSDSLDQDEFYSPLALKSHSSQQKAAGIRRSSALGPNTSNISNSGSTVFCSPRGLILSSPMTNVSAITHGTGASSSFKSLPNIEMLSIDNIKTCKSPGELRHIVEVLNSERLYPSLLRIAKEQLQILLKGRGEEKEQNLGGTKEERTGIDDVPMLMTLPPDESSLVMSLSSSCLDATNIERELDIQSAIEEVDEHDITPIPPPEQNQLDEQSTHGGSNSESTKAKSCESEKALSEEVKRLTETVVEMDSARRVDQSEFLVKLQALEKAKSEAAEKVRTLEEKVNASNASNKELLRSLDQMRHERWHLQQSLDAEREKWQIEHKKAKDVEDSLRQKTKELSEKLALAEQKSLRANADLEQRLRAEHEYEMNDQIATNEEINQVLRDAHSNLDNVKKERDTILTSILKILGKDDWEESQLKDDQERKQLVDGISRKISTMQASSNAMAKEMALSEKDRLKATKDQERAKKRLHESTMSQRRLERENKFLMKEIEKLSDELSKSRAYIDEKLNSASTHQSAEWITQEKKYKQIITNLKEQLRKDDTMVSLRLYMDALDEARKKSSENEENKKEIDELTKKIANLELKLEKNAHSTQKNIRSSQKDRNKFTSTSESNVAKEQRRVGIERQTPLATPNTETKLRATLSQKPEQPTDDSVKLHIQLQNPQETKIKRSEAFEQKSARKEAYILDGATQQHKMISPHDKENIGNTRREAVRAAGGRKGMQEKLNKLRSLKKRQSPRAITMH